MPARWAEYLTRIPKDATTIYILTEAAGYAYVHPLGLPNYPFLPACRHSPRWLS